MVVSHLTSAPSHLAEGIIKTHLNASLLLSFLTGIYTMIYVTAVYLYAKKKGPTPQRRVVIFAITVLYMTCSLMLGVRWFILQWSLTKNGREKDIIAEAFISPPRWAKICTILFQNIPFIVADGLLIWRCFHLWGRSRRLVLPPLLLVFAECGLIIRNTWMYYVYGLSKAVYDLNAAAFYVSVSTTIVLTSLICLRIYQTTSLTSKTTFGRFKYTVRVLTESAAIYTCILIFGAVCGMDPSFEIRGSPMLNFVGAYFYYIMPITAGMAPTILIARISDPRSDAPYVATMPEITSSQFPDQWQAPIDNAPGPVIDLRENSAPHGPQSPQIDLEAANDTGRIRWVEDAQRSTA